VRTQRAQAASGQRDNFVDAVDGLTEPSKARRTREREGVLVEVMSQRRNRGQRHHEVAKPVRRPDDNSSH
jgi:hypothetical protein